MMRVTAAAPQRFVRGTYLPTLLILYQCSTSALTLLAPARLPYMLGRVVLRVTITVCGITYSVERFK